MPLTFLLPKERESFDKVYSIEEWEVRQYFYLTSEDKRFLERFNGRLNRIAIIIQLGLIRLMGYLPPNWENQVSPTIVEFVLNQIYSSNLQGVLLLKEYGKWGKVRTEHLQQILKHLDYRRWQPIMDEPIIEKWLIERGMEHDNERWLLEKLC